MTKDLVRPSAFTGKFEISEELWRKVQEKYALDQAEPSAQLFLAKSFEKFYELLAKQTGVDCKVACIMLEFNNYKVINLLQKKSDFLKWGKVEDATIISDQIDEILQSEQDSLWRPVKVFVTFHT